MTHSFQQEYEALMLKANDYHKKALWQEKLRVLQDALAICDEADFPDVEQRRQSLHFDVAGIWRRLGQYSRAEKTLKPLAVLTGATSAFKASVLGEVTRVRRFYSMQPNKVQASLALWQDTTVVLQMREIFFVNKAA